MILSKRIIDFEKRPGIPSILWMETLAVLLAFLISIFSGRYRVELIELFSIFTFSSDDAELQILFWLVRLPRSVLVLTAGAALALAGTVYQSVFRNPLVSPDILGVSSGASLGAVLSILLWHNTGGIAQLASFCGGILAVVLAMGIVRASRNDSTLGFILGGVMISSVASSLVMLFKYFADPYRQLPAIEFWMMGGFYNADWEKVLNILPVCCLAAISIFLLRWQLKVLTLGDDEARSLGVRVKLVRGILVIAATALVAAAVSVAGLVSWVGLVAPNIVRMITGDTSSKSLAASLGVGAVILLLSDTLARSITASEIPISVITSFIGAPFLGYLLWKAGHAL
ncbi:MAG: iron ABC transporter permease [Clostridia bacterium]|nr:iron ABC transporter permease [Clostridia bacterium]